MRITASVIICVICHPFRVLTTALKNHLEYKVGVALCAQRCLMTGSCISIKLDIGTLNCQVTLGHSSAAMAKLYPVVWKTVPHIPCEIDHHLVLTKLRGAKCVPDYQESKGLSDVASHTNQSTCINDTLWNKADLNSNTKIKQSIKGRKKFGDHCSDHGDCGYQNGQCLGKRCSCVIGYSYDFDRNECVTSCLRYGSLFSVYDGTAVKGCNVKKAYGRYDRKQCMEACRSESSFTCVQCDYKSLFGVGFCEMCNETWNNIKEEDKLVGTEPDWELLYRHCEN